MSAKVYAPARYSPRGQRYLHGAVVPGARGACGLRRPALHVVLQAEQAHHLWEEDLVGLQLEKPGVSTCGRIGRPQCGVGVYVFKVFKDLRGVE